MNAAIGAVRQAIEITWLLLQAGARNVAGNWPLAAFSVVIAFGTWVIIQDVENPRVEGLAPPEGEQAIQVEYVNSSDLVTVVDAHTVRVIVEAREDQLGELRASHFRATVDLQGLEAGEVVNLPVTVTATVDDVEVLEVQPATVSIELEQVVVRELKVQVRQAENGVPLPAGYELDEPPVISPQFVTVRGTSELVANVDRVEVDVDFSGRRADFEVTRDLVARNANGQTQTVSLSSRQATVSFSVAQIIQQREFAVRPVFTGALAEGHRVTAVHLNPSVVRVNASDDLLEGIAEVVLEPMDVAGATDDLTRTVRVQSIPNAIVVPEQVEVTVVIEPITCDEIDDEQPCATSVVIVQPQFAGLPAGLAVGPGVYLVRVDVIGSPLDLAALRPEGIVATVPLAGLPAGVHTITPEVTAPESITVAAVRPLTIPLVAAP